jgi:hypothetical protein
MSILVFVMSGVLVLGGAITVVAGAVVASKERDSLAVAGFVVGGSGMILAGGIGVTVGYLLYPEASEAEATPVTSWRPPAVGPTLTVRF